MSLAPAPPLRRAWHGLRTAFYATPLHRLRLGGRMPRRLVPVAPLPWPGDPAAADLLFHGRFRFAGHEVAAAGQPPWRLGADQPRWQAELHGFAWLGHLAAHGGEAAATTARRLVRSWIELCGRWDAETWAPAVLAERLIAWLAHAEFLLADADQAFRDLFLDALARQARHLACAADMAPAGRPAVRVAAALVAAGAALHGETACGRRGTDLLQRELDRQVLGDGGHVGRAPSVHMAVLADLIWLRSIWQEAGQPPEVAVQHAIDRMAPLLRALRHGDGALAVFNGGFEETAAAVDRTLGLADVKGRAQMNAPHAGYQRCVAGRTVLIADAGPPAPAGLDPPPFAGTLSFELSVGRQRLVVNCGSGLASPSAAWAEASRTTAAHSTLVLHDTNSTELLAEGSGGRRPREVLAGRQEDEDGNHWLDLEHDGYLAAFGARHRRRLYLSAGGEDLRGADSLDGPEVARAGGRGWALRFHLHPDVQASPIHGGGSLLLKLPGGQGWRFRCADGEPQLADSVYLGRAGEMRRTHQIVLGGIVPDDGRLEVKWAFRKV